jgi:hypothetical protein
MLPSPYEHLLPIYFDFSSTIASVKWMDFGLTRLTEPFFHQTVRRLRTGDPPATERVTSLDGLFEIAEGFPSAVPAGLIFHVSRCGSTLVANALRQDEHAIVLSEADPVGTCSLGRPPRDSSLSDTDWDQTRTSLIKALVTIFGWSGGGSDSRLVIKCHAISLFQICWIRSIWPTTPCLIVIRDPLEVIMSQLLKPAGWMKWHCNLAAARATFGWSADGRDPASIEEYAARGLGTFFAAARDAVDDRCRVIDYRKLDPVRLCHIAGFFGLSLPSPGSPSFKAVLAAYSKDPSGSRQFLVDEQIKQSKASEAAREAVLRWARPQYEMVRALDSW